MEEWRPVVGFEGIYSVSSEGRVRRDIDGFGIGANKTRAGHVMKRWQTKMTAYPMVSLRKIRGVSRPYCVHRLVAKAFLGPIPDGLEVNHKNGDKTDARLENLELVTKSGNMRHAYDNGLVRVARGERHWNRKFNENSIRFIRAMHGRLNLEELGFLFNSNASVICAIVHRKAWKHVPDEVSA